MINESQKRKTGKLEYHEVTLDGNNVGHSVLHTA